MKKDLLSMIDVSGILEHIIDDAIKMKKGNYQRVMNGKTMAMIFEKSSTRTRVSFEVGVEKLGGHALFLNKNDLQMGRGESIEDTARVLSRYVDIIMYRSFSSDNMKALARHATIPVINGLDNEEHPCQVIADLMTIREHKGKLAGLKIVYFGDGNNNMAHSLLLGCALSGMCITIVAPKQYWPNEFYVSKAREFGYPVEIQEIGPQSAKNADVVITDTWISMGDETEKQKRLELFKSYTVTKTVMCTAKPDVIFMHCLPAYYGYEVEKDVVHGPQSVIFDEAENRMWTQMSIIKWLLS